MAAKFFCENCKFEVPLSAVSCPYCRKVFYSVYCPRCGKEGSPQEFRNGCPACGYLKESYKSSRRSKKPMPSLPPEPISLPRWFYGWAIVVLSLGIIGLLVLLALGIKLP